MSSGRLCILEDFSLVRIVYSYYEFISYVMCPLHCIIIQLYAYFFKLCNFICFILRRCIRHFRVFVPKIVFRVLWIIYWYFLVVPKIVVSTLSLSFFVAISYIVYLMCALYLILPTSRKSRISVNFFFIAKFSRNWRIFRF